MLRNQLCLKRNITFDDINDDIPDHRNSEIEAIIRTDINNIISTLSEKIVIYVNYLRYLLLLKFL